MSSYITGEKIVPGRQEGFLVSLPFVSGAVIFGEGRRQAVRRERPPDHRRAGYDAAGSGANVSVSSVRVMCLRWAAQGISLSVAVFIASGGEAQSPNVWKA